ncbi:MAG TPA: hypothetical protein DEQ43_10450, partial [Nocardioides bacterium]|nr:hypothetical protein [Nocardioides sp.]
MRRPGTKTLVVAGLLVALILAGVISRFASSDPDGLTKVSEDHGFADTGSSHQALLGDYGSLTGIVGVLVVLAVAAGIAFAVRRRDRAREDDRQDEPQDEP